MLQEYGPEVAYLLANLLSYMGPSRVLMQPTVTAAAAILNIWGRRKIRLIETEGILHDSKVFALLEAAWAQLYVHPKYLLLLLLLLLLGILLLLRLLLLSLAHVLLWLYAVSLPFSLSVSVSLFLFVFCLLV